MLLKTKNNRISFRAETLPEADRLQKIFFYIRQFSRESQHLDEVDRCISIELNTELIKDIDKAGNNWGLGGRSETIEQILDMAMPRQTQKTEEESIRLTVNFSRSLLEKIDEVRKEWGLRSRGATVERILQELFEECPVQESIEEAVDQPQPLANQPT